MNDDLTLLASAYLDGDVTADERARVEADSEVLAEVDRLRSVRALLSDVEPPSISVREAQLSTALDAWDRLPPLERTGARRDNTPVGVDAAALAGAAAVSAPTPLSNRRRSRSSSTRWLTGAAAALVLVLAGGVALQLGTTDDGADTDDASAAVAAVEVTQAADDAQRDAESSESAEAAPQAATAEAVPELDTGIDSAAPPGENAGVNQLDTLQDLADFAAAAIGAPSAPDVPAATSAASDEELSEAETFLAEAEFPRCLGVDTIVGPAVFGDIPVVVGIDEGRSLAIAYRAANCAEVARVRLP
jgi:hypothetical protein